ncbi:MAG: LOG family protein [Bradymonadia bacterium]
MKEIHDIPTLEAHLATQQSLAGHVIQGLDLTPFTHRLSALPEGHLDGAVCLGCALDDAGWAMLRRRGALVFPALEGLPFEPYRPHLYTPEEIYAGFDPAQPETYAQTPDAQIYDHWASTGRATPDSIMEALARRLHDHAMTDAVDDFLSADEWKPVAIMGGHSMSRADAGYRTMAHLARLLTERGYLMLSGGGPGAMEAAHLGAWFVERSATELDAAVDHLALAPKYTDALWLSRAFEVRERWPAEGERHHSLGIPTWLYGHEPPNPFASHIAKYFANSVREDGLVTLARHGIVFAPGSAGTIQEIFQDATQNHYATLGEISPMIFFDTCYWTETKPVYPLLKQLAADRPYGEYVTICDTVDEIIQFIEAHPPKGVE